MKPFIIILLALVTFSFADIKVSGEVKTASGETPLQAHVHIIKTGQSVRQPMKTITVDAKGHFETTLQNGSYYTLYVTAVDHYASEIPLLAQDDQKVNVKITMPGYNFADDLSQTAVIGHFNDFNFQTAENMTPAENGTYVYEVESDAEKVGYQLLNVEKTGHSINGTQAIGYEYDGGGDYISYAPVKDGKAHIVFDPAKLKKSGGELKVVFDDEQLNAILEIEKTASEYRSSFYSNATAYGKEHGSYKGFNYDASEIIAYLDKYLNSESKVVSSFAALKMLDIPLSDNAPVEKRAEKLIALLPVESPMWSIEPRGMDKAYVMAMGDDALTYLENNLDKIDDKRARAIVLAGVGTRYQKAGNESKVATIHKTLVDSYSDVREVQYDVHQLDPNKAVAKGKPVPEFEVTLMNSDEKVSNKALLGQYYLMDFWAVWCGPCRAEMPRIHEAYKEFSGDNFTILSLSFDRKPEDVDKYREETWAMPWLHTFLEGGFRNELSQRFEVMGIPKPILVNPEGKIVAVGDELRGEGLHETLSKFLNTTM